MPGRIRMLASVRSNRAETASVGRGPARPYSSVTGRRILVRARFCADRLAVRKDSRLEIGSLIRCVETAQAVFVVFKAIIYCLMRRRGHSFQ